MRMKQVALFTVRGGMPRREQRGVAVVYADPFTPAVLVKLENDPDKLLDFSYELVRPLQPQVAADIAAIAATGAGHEVTRQEHPELFELFHEQSLRATFTGLRDVSVIGDPRAQVVWRLDAAFQEVTGIAREPREGDTKNVPIL